MITVCCSYSNKAKYYFVRPNPLQDECHFTEIESQDDTDMTDVISLSAEWPIPSPYVILESRTPSQEQHSMTLIKESWGSRGLNTETKS